MSVYRERHVSQTRTFDGSAGFGFIVEVPQCRAYAPDGEGRGPLGDAFVPVDPSISRTTTPRSGLILRVARSWNDAKVATAVVQAVTVNVIDAHRWVSIKPHNSPVQLDDALPFDANGLVSPGISRSVDVPDPLVSPFGIGCIDHCIPDDLTVPSAQRDHADVAGENRRGGANAVPRCAALGRAVRFRAHSRRMSQHRHAAMGTGNMYGHQAHFLVSSPRPARTGAGVVCVNYTTGVPLWFCT